MDMLFFIISLNRAFAHIKLIISEFFPLFTGNGVCAVFINLTKSKFWQYKIKLLSLND